MARRRGVGCPGVAQQTHALLEPQGGVMRGGQGLAAMGFLGELDQDKLGCMVVVRIFPSRGTASVRP